MDTRTSLADQVEELSTKINNLSVIKVASVMHCEDCGGGHSQNDCPITVRPSGPTEQVDFVGNAIRLQSNSYSNIYNTA